MARELFLVPTSFAQQRLWFLDQLEPGGSVFNIPSALRISGPLDVDVLRRSVEEVVNRHETLRTRFVSQVAAVRSEILDGDGVGVHDNFFEVGGTSGKRYESSKTVGPGAHGRTIGTCARVKLCLCRRCQ
jgi:hypothetical protein